MIGLFTRLARVRRLDHGEEATLVEHLTELRDRLIACVVVLGVVFAVAFWRYHDLFDILNRPLPHKLQESKPITTEIGEAFTLTILISVYTAILITFPFTLYQLYAYLIPAFSSDTAKRIKPVLLFIPLLFTAGAAFGYFVVVPSAVRFLYYWASDEVNPLPRARSIYPFEMTMMFVMGIIFEMPAAVWVLTRAHVLSSRVMKKNRRVAIVAARGHRRGAAGHGSRLDAARARAAAAALRGLDLGRARRRARARGGRRRRRRRRGVSTLFAADWVVPVSSPPLARRRGARGGGADRRRSAMPARSPRRTLAPSGWSFRAACSRPASSTSTRTSNTRPTRASATASRSAPGSPPTPVAPPLSGPRGSTRWRSSAPPSACAPV